MSRMQQASNEELVARIQAGEDVQENMLRLWQQNKGFVVKIARRYSAGAEMEDLEQEGYIALHEAVKNYNPERGMSFINYSAFYIKRRMRICADNNRAVHLSSCAEDEVQQYKKILRQYQQEYGCKPSDLEMSSFLCVSQEKLKQIKKTAQMSNIKSLSEPVQGADEDLSLGDTVASPENMEAEVIQKIDREQMKRELWLAVDQLPGKGAGILRLIYQGGITREQAGARMGVSATKAREIEYKALRTLRQPSRNKRFRKYHEEYLHASTVQHVGVRKFGTTWTSEVEREVLYRL